MPITLQYGEELSPCFVHSTEGPFGSSPSAVFPIHHREFSSERIYCPVVKSPCKSSGNLPDTRISPIRSSVTTRTLYFHTHSFVLCTSKKKMPFRYVPAITHPLSPRPPTSRGGAATSAGGLKRAARRRGGWDQGARAWAGAGTCTLRLSFTQPRLQVQRFAEQPRDHSFLAVLGLVDRLPGEERQHKMKRDCEPMGCRWTLFFFGVLPSVVRSRIDDRLAQDRFFFSRRKVGNVRSGILCGIDFCHRSPVGYLTGNGCLSGGLGGGMIGLREKRRRG